MRRRLRRDDFDYEVHLAAYYTQDGIRKGLEESHKERDKAILKMVKMGIPMETILKCYELSREEIEKINDKIDEWWINITKGELILIKRHSYKYKRN